MAFKDLREWIEFLEKEGELARVSANVDLEGEVAAISRKVLNKNGPALLFENIESHKNTPCTKLFQGSFGTLGRLSMMLGLSKDTKRRKLTDVLRQRLNERIKPVIVDGGPVKENILMGDQIDLNAFPVPKWHEFDGGRYINTWCGIVTKDPDNGWVNVGTYRGMIADKNKISVLLLYSQHWGVHYKKYQKMGKPMPVAVVYGWDPVMEFTAACPLPLGVPEYEVMGALRGEPVPLVKCETVDLYVPASAEIVIEGQISSDPETFEWEGPFGEFTGYYGGQKTKRPCIEVSCITYRNDPIYRGGLEGAGPGAPNEDLTIYSVVSKAQALDVLEKAGIPGILDIRVGPVTYVKIDQTYQSQARQIAAALWGSWLTEYHFKIVMVVNEDIDIYDSNALDRAFVYRVNPREDLVVFPGTRGGALDPSQPLEDRDEIKLGSGRWNRLLIDATVNLNNQKEWFGRSLPPFSTEIEPKYNELIRRRWQEYGIGVKLD